MPRRERPEDVRARADRKVKALNTASKLIRGGEYQGDQLSRLSTETLHRALQDTSGQARHAGLVKNIKEILTKRS